MYKKFFVREYIRKIINEIIDKSEDDEFDDINLSDHKNYSNWVFIHRNLNKPPYWSIKRGKSGGNVIGYDKTIKLKDVEFKVQKGGQSRVRKEKRKNVHAGVVGKIIDSGKNYNTKGWTLVTYNPYVNNTFVEYETGKPIHNAKEAILKNTKEVWVKKEDEDILEEKWSNKYKKSIDCKNPKGFSQRAHCQGRKKKELDEYGRTLKMARRQGSGTRFPKSVIKTNPSRFRKYSRLKESDIEKYEKIKKLIINEETLGKVQKDYVSLNDIWYGFDKLYHGDYQTTTNGPLNLVQQALYKKFPKYAKEINFTPDKDFGDKTSKMIGKLFGIKYNDLSSVSIGPKTLEKLGFKKPVPLTLDELIVTLNLVMEQAKPNEDEIKGIANVIANRQSIGNHGSSMVDVVLKPYQFSEWNKHQPVSRDIKTIRNIMKGRPKEDRYQNRKSWDLAVTYAKLLSQGGNFEDNTNGSTHYYNPNKSIPPWGPEKSPETWEFIKTIGDHNFGRDGSTTHYKNFKGRWKKHKNKKT